MRKRDKSIQVMVTEPEKKRIMRKAKRCGLSISDYFRELADGHNPAEYPFDLHWLCFQVELLLEDYYGRHDEEVTAYLKSFLDDVRVLLFSSGGEK